MDNISIESIRKFNKLVEESNTISIITHRRPDIDAICSCLSMYLYLISIGKKSELMDIIIPNYNINYSKIFDLKNIKKKARFPHYDLTLVLDCSNKTVLSCSDILYISEKVVCIDHHNSFPNFNVELSLNNSNSSSCTCILYELLSCVTYKFFELIALGIISDTYVFKINFNAKAKEILSAIKDFGININTLISIITDLNARIYNLSALAMKRGYFRGKNKNIFCTYLLQDDLMDNEKELTNLDHKSIIMEIQNKLNFSSLILLIEKGDYTFKSSVLTLNNNINLFQILLDVNKNFPGIHGGGHHNSIGFNSSYSIELTFSLFIEELDKFPQK